jgi:hypothetical protein
MGTNQKQVPNHQLLEKLTRRLLALGGEKVGHQEGAENWAANLLARGQLFTLPVKFRFGVANRCHANAAGIWAKDIQRYRLVTGYALSGGLWVDHSWVLDKTSLIETTCKREKYFGYPMTPWEALKLFLGSYLPERYPGPVSLMRMVVDGENSAKPPSGLHQ